jgi:regulatory protein
MVYTVTEALNQLKKYCAYQERCQQEIRQKLAKWPLTKEEQEFVIAELISEGYLNEERFARSFARGKFKIKKWGRKKIVYSLRSKGISEYCIRLGLQEISVSEYEALIRSEIHKYSRKYSKQALMRLLISHGFEPELLVKWITKD